MLSDCVYHLDQLTILSSKSKLRASSVSVAMNTSESQSLEVVHHTPHHMTSMPEDDFTKPWSQYTRLFQEHPEHAASLAKELFSANDLKYLPFILSCPWDFEDASQVHPGEELHSSNFLIALLDIASDKRWYKQLRDGKIAGPKDAGRKGYWAAVCSCSLFSSTRSDILTILSLRS